MSIRSMYKNISNNIAVTDPRVINFIGLDYFSGYSLVGALVGGFRGFMIGFAVAAVEWSLMRLVCSVIRSRALKSVDKAGCCGGCCNSED